MEPNQIYKPLLSKGNHKQTKIQSMNWEKIFAKDATNVSSVSEIYKQLI